MARSYEQRILHFALPFVPKDLEIKLHVDCERALVPAAHDGQRPRRDKPIERLVDNF